MEKFLVPVRDGSGRMEVPGLSVRPSYLSKGLRG